MQGKKLPFKDFVGCMFDHDNDDELFLWYG